jgi:thymidylate kinase
VSKPSLIVVTGPDGSGKSSVIAEMIRSLNLKHGEGFAVSASVWDSMLAFKSFRKEDVEKYLGGLSSPSRALFIFHALSNSLNMAQSGKARVIFSDGYFYKYAATELAYGVDPEAIRGACVSFQKPDYTFFLEISPEEAFARKEKVTHYEGGEKFVEFQKKAIRYWAELEKTYGPWIHLGHQTGIQERADQILKHVKI